MEKELLEAKRIVDTYQTNIKEIDNDMKGNGNAGNEKYEILFQKEKEITDFTEQFQRDKVDHEKEIMESQQTIANILEHMQKTMARQNKLPTSK